MRISCLLLMMFIGVKTYSQTIICAGGQHTLAIKTDSTLWGWGANTSGQLGLGSIYDSGHKILLYTDFTFTLLK